MRILHTVAGLRDDTGGPVASITSLCAGLASRGHEVTLLTGAGPLHEAVLTLRPRVRLRTEPLGPYSLGHWSRAFRAACLEEVRRADVVHDHGVWLYTNWTSVGIAAHERRPIVRSPRGMLSPWALGRSRLLKRLVWSSIERSLFDRASLVHVTSPQEDADVRRLGIRAPTVVIPNGIDLDGEFAASNVLDARARGIPEARGRRVVLFLSRVHPVKGLDLLCQAWETLPRDLPALLLVAGTGHSSALAQLRLWMGKQPGPAASYIGPVKGKEKLALLSTAWVVALPSRSENYGMVVAEALASGTPALTTTAMPWSAVSAAGCGWVVPPEVAPLAHALGKALQLSATDHASMRDRARQFVVRDHSLNSAVLRMEQRYRALATPRPED